MNNNLLIPLLLEASILLMTIGFGYIFVAWRKKKKHLAELDQLLKTIKDSDEARKQFFMTALSNNFEMNDADALPIADRLMQTEKTFMHDFVTNFFTQKQKGLSDFFSLTCVMTENQFASFPKISTQPPEQQPEKPEIIDQAEKEPDETELTFDISIDEVEETANIEPEAEKEITVSSVEQVVETSDRLTELSELEINQQDEEFVDDELTSHQEKTEELTEAVISLDDEELEVMEELVNEDLNINTTNREEPSWDDAFTEVEEPQSKESSAKKTKQIEKETILEQI